MHFSIVFTYWVQDSYKVYLNLYLLTGIAGGRCNMSLFHHTALQKSPLQLQTQCFQNVASTSEALFPEAFSIYA